MPSPTKALGTTLSVFATALVSAYPYPPLVPATDQYTTLTLTLDRSTLGNTRHYIWQKKQNGYGGNNIPYGGQAPYSNTFWYCYSQSDSGFGAGNCTSRQTTTIPHTPLRLRFTEQRTQITQDITLYAHYNFVGCAALTESGINSSSFSYCLTPGIGGEPFYNHGKTLTVWVDEQELKPLPIGGNWKATLKLKQFKNPQSTTTWSNWQGTIDITLRDGASATVWFPQQQTSTPRHDLALKTRLVQTMPGGIMYGRSNLDMCLYDGMDNKSTRYSLTLTDDVNISGRSSDRFSVFHHGVNDNSLRKRIDYQIQLSYNGQDAYLDNNVVRELPSLDPSQLRPVYLPGIPTPVMCAPAPLTFITPEFNKNEKETGPYQGSVRVVFTATL